jgi:hypothetical protein
LSKSQKPPEYFCRRLAWCDNPLFFSAISARSAVRLDKKSPKILFYQGEGEGQKEHRAVVCGKRIEIQLPIIVDFSIIRRISISFIRGVAKITLFP